MSLSGEMQVSHQSPIAGGPSRSPEIVGRQSNVPLAEAAASAEATADRPAARQRGALPDYGIVPASATWDIRRMTVRALRGERHD